MADITPLSSSNLSGAGYDPESREMTVIFTSGGEYVYSEVDQATFDGLLQAPSPGRYFAQNIRGVFSYRRAA